MENELDDPDLKPTFHFAGHMSFTGNYARSTHLVMMKFSAYLCLCLLLRF